MSGLSRQAYRAQRALKTQSPTNLFESPTNIIKAWRAGAVGAKEWQNSTYSWNKQAQKTLPTATVVAENLLKNYMTIVRSRGRFVSRSAVTARRRTQERMFMSEPTLKDHGDRLVLDAFVYDAGKAAQEDRELEIQKEEAVLNARKGNSAAASKYSGPPGRTRAGPPGARGSRYGSPGYGRPRSSGPRSGGPGSGGPRSNNPGSGGSGYGGPRPSGSGFSRPRPGVPQSGIPRSNGPRSGGPRPSGSGVSGPRPSSPRPGGAGSGGFRSNGPRPGGSRPPSPGGTGPAR